MARTNPPTVKRFRPRNDLVVVLLLTDEEMECLQILRCIGHVERADPVHVSWRGISEGYGEDCQRQIHLQGLGFVVWCWGKWYITSEGENFLRQKETIQRIEPWPEPKDAVLTMHCDLGEADEPIIVRNS